MNIDGPDYSYAPQPTATGYETAQLPPQPQAVLQQQQQYPDYYTYATTTAQMVDPWAFNHASLLATLSQLPPDLLPSLLPHMNQSGHISAQGVSALAAAAAAAAATVPAMGGVQQPPQQLYPDHVFAVPAVPLHQQHGGAAANAPGIAALPSISNLAQPAQLPVQQPAYGYAAAAGRQQPGAYLGNMYYANSSLQPLMVPPPSPTILSYYQADPTHLMSLLGQNAYQPQAYHYDYPLPPHR
ncbi:hypothetical protein H4R19_005664, partial [Coemansia spiralis]